MSKKQNQGSRKGGFSAFIRYFGKFRIPWWLYLISVAAGVAYTEVSLLLVDYTVMLNTGELYNNALLGYAGYTLLLSAISIVVNMAGSVYGGGKVTLRSRSVIWRKILHLPARELDQHEPSTLVARVTAEADDASGVIYTITALITSTYSLVRAFIELFAYNNYITFWLLLAIPLAVITFWVVGKLQFIGYRKKMTAYNSMTAFFSEHLGTVKHTKAQATEELERKNGFREIEKRFRADVLYSFFVSAQTSCNSLYTRLCFLILVFTGKREIAAGRLEATGLNRADTLLSNVQKYLAEELTHYMNIKGAQGTMARVVELSEAGEEVLRRDADMPCEPGDIVLEHVSFGYTADREILHDLTLTIPAGKKTAIVGDNGSGKSTLFKLLMRFYQPDSGTITYGGTPIESIHMDQWRRSFGFVLQHAPLFSGSIRDNILYGVDREVSDEEIITAAKIANAYDFIMEFPEGFDKEVGEGGAYLSGGQRQRIAIARSVMVNPSLMLLDEATSALDYQSNQQVWEGMRRAMQGRTTVLIAHDMESVTSADHIIVMRAGTIEAAGTHEQLMEISPTYREYVCLQNGKDGEA